jgi:hypothetical protein
MERRHGSEGTQSGDSGEILYRLNDEDQIIFVNNAWDEFATANEGEHLARGHVLRRYLWDFITDSTTQQLYRDVLKRVRSGRPVRFGFRCDSPDRRRLMEMDILPKENRAIEFRTRTVAEERREPQVLLEVHQNRNDELLRMCSWCKKVDIGGDWAEVEDAVARLRLFEQAVLPNLTHGICETCFTNATSELLAP